MLFLDVCKEMARVFSRKFYKEYFFEAALEVAQVRLKKLLLLILDTHNSKYVLIIIGFCSECPAKSLRFVSRNEENAQDAFRRKFTEENQQHGDLVPVRSRSRRKSSDESG